MGDVEARPNLLPHFFTVAVIGFTQCQYSFEESDERVIIIEVLQGMLNTNVQLMLTSSDETAEGS